MAEARNTRAWRRLRRQVLLRDGWRCRWCGGMADTADHVVALAEGGAPFDPSNLVAACRSCNARRGAQLVNARRSLHGDAAPARHLGMAGNTPRGQGSRRIRSRGIVPGAIDADGA